MSSLDREQELLRAAVGGDRAALLKILSRSRPNLFDRVSRRIPAALAATVDADDVIQNTHVEVLRRIRDFRLQDCEAFDRWVMTIAIRRLRDAVRRHRAAKRGAGRRVASDDRAVSDSMVALFQRVAKPGQTPSRVVARQEMALLTRRAIEQLPEEYRGLIWSVYIEGRSMHSVADELGRTEGAIRVACYKARRRLRELLGDSAQFFSRSG